MPRSGYFEVNPKDNALHPFSEFSFNDIYKGIALFYQKNGEIKLCSGKVKRHEVLDPNQFSVFFSDFFWDEKKPWLTFDSSYTVKVEDFLSKLDNVEKESFSCNFFEPSKDKWNFVFSQIQSLIQSEELQKLVPVVFAEADFEMTKEKLCSLIDFGIKNVGEQNFYLIWDGVQGVVGVTPEVLFSKKGNVLQTMALAGTGKSSDPEGSLLSDLKEVTEHQFVVDSLKQRLSIWGEVKVDEMYEWEILPLKHLRTNLTCRLSEKNQVIDIIKKLHPTPALGTYPVEKWMKYKTLLNIERKSFGAPVGYCEPGGMQQFLVAIRNLMWNESKLFLGAGCGVVKESQLDKEWNELKLKRSSVKQRLGFS